MQRLGCGTAILVVGCLLIRAMFSAIVGPNIGVDEILPISAGSAAWTIRQAVLEKPGTERLLKDGYALYAAHRPDGTTQWVVQNLKTFQLLSPTQALRDLGGQLSKFQTYSDLRNFLLDNGWKSVTALELPLIVRNFFSQGLRWIKVALGISGSSPMILVIPVGLLENEHLRLIEVYEGVDL